MRTMFGVLLAAALAVPATAQSNSGAVVCVGSEPEQLMGANQLPQTFRKDLEMGYVTDVDRRYMEEAEQAVREHLAGHATIWCERPGPGDTHVMVVSFAAVFRRDDKLDPEDPRIQNFAVGFGTSWSDAEAHATSLNERFTTYNDGSPYRALLQLRWGRSKRISTGPWSRGLSRRVCFGTVKPVRG